jgi:hypothetical protein
MTVEERLAECRRWLVRGRDEDSDAHYEYDFLIELILDLIEAVAQGNDEPPVR